MKKLFAAVLIGLLVVSGIPVLAADPMTGKDEERSVDVRARYVEGAATTDVYSVEVVWEAMEFTYKTSGTRQWDPASHQYQEAVSGTWSESGNSVTVTNHSNRAVEVVFSYQSAAGFEGIRGSFSVPSARLAAGEVGNVAGADKIRTALTLSGDLSGSVTELTKIGSVIITLQ